MNKHYYLVTFLTITTGTLAVAYLIDAFSPYRMSWWVISGIILGGTLSLWLTRPEREDNTDSHANPRHTDTD